jgi:hypothetical protein
MLNVSCLTGMTFVRSVRGEGIGSHASWYRLFVSSNFMQRSRRMRCDERVWNESIANGDRSLHIN